MRVQQEYLAQVKRDFCFFGVPEERGNGRVEDWLHLSELEARLMRPLAVSASIGESLSFTVPLMAFINAFHRLSEL